ncbi:hypothetical protein Tco_1238208 [Tanacetum coccineum]
MRISGFVHGITIAELSKYFHEKIPKTVDEIMQSCHVFSSRQEAALKSKKEKVPRPGAPRKGIKAEFKKVGLSAANIRRRKAPDGQLFSRKLRRKFGLGKRKIQDPTSNDNPG